MMPQPVPLNQHNAEIQENLKFWEAKPLLRKIYRGFHQEIARYVRTDLGGITVELGSGIGNIKEVVPDCLRTDLFPNPWLDQTEDAYRLSFKSSSVSNIILFDVFHHLRYPGTAFEEFKRVLKPGGRVIIFDPCLSLLGLVVYGALHHEPIAIGDAIQWKAPHGWSPDKDSYYAAQGNAFRIFYAGNNAADLSDFNLIQRKRFACISYVASGGYSKPQLYPDKMFPFMKFVDTVANFIPWVCATRLLVVLERRS
jgi:SAM-dependent methyltransferase